MADNSMENLISNYGNMSIEELGGSLLQRQSDIAAAQAKEDKKNRKFQQAIGLLTAGQALFKNATKKRLKELDDLQAFNMQDNVEQSKQIKTIGRIGANMPDKTWFADRKDMDVNTLTKEIMEDERYSQNLKQNLSPVIDAVIKQGVPEEEFAMFKKGTSEYDTAFDLGLHNLISNYVSPYVDRNGKQTGKRNFEMYESELRELLNAGNLDDAKLFEQAIAITPNTLNLAEKRYYSRLKNEYANKGYIESFKDIFTKIGSKEESKGRRNLFRNVDKTDLYGSNINDILTTLNIEGPLITSIDKSLAKYRTSASQAMVSAKTDPDLIARSSLAIDSFGRNLGNKRLYNADNTLKMSERGAWSWGRYMTDINKDENQKQAFAKDVAGLTNAFQSDTDFAVAAFTSSLEDNNIEVTDDMVAEFYQKISSPDNESYRMNLAIAVAANEGFQKGGGFLARKPEYYTPSFDKVTQDYKYDRFKGSIPAILGEGIAVPSQTSTGNYQEDASYSKMSVEDKKIAFDNQLKYIEQSKISSASKMKLIENLFNNVKQPEFDTPQEYLEAYPPESRKQQFRLMYISGVAGSGQLIQVPVNNQKKKSIIEDKQKNNSIIVAPINDTLTELQTKHLTQKNKDGTPRFTYDNLDNAQQKLYDLSSVLLYIESDGNFDAVNLNDAGVEDKQSARGGWQFKPASVDPAVVRFERVMGVMSEFDEVKKTKDVRDLSPEFQNVLVMADLLEKTAVVKGEKKPGLGDTLIQNYLDAENPKEKRKSVYEIYKVLHHAGTTMPIIAKINTKTKLRKYFN